VVALDAACWLLSQKAFTFGVQELFDLVHLSGFGCRSFVGLGSTRWPLTPGGGHLVREDVHHGKTASGVLS
jgi:hypothetical protein